MQKPILISGLQWGVCCECGATMPPDHAGHCRACIERLHGAPLPDLIGCPECLGGEDPPPTGICPECNGTDLVPAHWG